MEQPDKPTALVPDPARLDDGSLRQLYLIKITKRLVALTAAALGVIAALGYLGHFLQARTYLGLYVFTAGLIGGFVSIQQRLPKIGLDELRELSGSWLSAVLIPINGGIFAIVLHLMFLGEILQGSLFPRYHHPPIVTDSVLASFQHWLMDTIPIDGQSLAKLFFWSFVAGFSERLVPQIIRKTAQEAEADK
jgi:hypothetical protein